MRCGTASSDPCCLVQVCSVNSGNDHMDCFSKLQIGWFLTNPAVDGFIFSQGNQQSGTVTLYPST